MAPFEALKLLLIPAVVLGLPILASCGPKPVTPVASVVTPVPKVYTCAQERKAKAEYDKLAADSMLRVLVDDYGHDRKDRWAALNMKPPPVCP
ncbi:MAG TPA: hypothetical protein VMI56_17075 [Reyranella sp.]|nr:hypothetical protein [Reyranella sp.]